MPGSAGIDGFYQRWVTYEGAKAFAFVNGPYRLLDKVIAKIMVERSDCILLAPSWPRPWLATIKSRLPVVFVFRLPATGPQGQPRFIPGPRVPADARRNHGKWPVNAYLIRWPPLPLASPIVPDDE